MSVGLELHRSNLMTSFRIWFNSACVTAISGRFDAHVRFMNIGTKPVVVGQREDAITSFFGRDRLSHLPTQPVASRLGIHLLFASEKETDEMEQNLRFRVCESSYHAFSHRSFDTKRDVASLFHQPPHELFAKKGATNQQLQGDAIIRVIWHR